MPEQKFAAVRLAPFRTTVDEDRVRRFAGAVGADDPVFHDPAAARAAGHPGVPLPPTLLFGIELEHRGVDALAGIGIPVDRVLHAEQRFTYHSPAHAGEELAFDTVVSDRYTRRGLEFVVQDTEITRDGTVVAELRQVLMAQVRA
ncbi:FAS1-like dehydratase domain-containing protein [Amycolatopsis benzoatilytica]|uniref:FAS1-like dehydratase domain-containing protein n=1 Tax=Amycolatopsis benzoatilytica TaxID=346045 RepID=UPI0003708D2A|nr:MaoC family dehydratase N-terminal domain-containing protein [Amycolatopsis benzoatilytica]